MRRSGIIAQSRQLNLRLTIVFLGDDESSSYLESPQRQNIQLWAQRDRVSGPWGKNGVKQSEIDASGKKENWDVGGMVSMSWPLKLKITDRNSH